MGSVAEKLSYLNGTKRLLRRRLNSLGANITLDTTFRDYLVWLDRFYNAASAPVNLEILGETTQKATTTSINLIPINDGQIVTDGITVVLSDGGKISVNGTATRNVWIKITNGIEAAYQDPAFNENDWVKEKLIEFDSGTTLYNQYCYGNGDAPINSNSSGVVIVTKESSGYGHHKELLPNLIIRGNKKDKDVEGTATLNNRLELNCVYLYFEQNVTVNQYFWVESCLTKQTKWQPNYDALPPSPDNHKRIINKQGNIIYTASDGTEFPVKLGGIGIYWIELAKIGDYKDRIYYKNGKFYLEKNIGMGYFDGDENWSYISVTQGNLFRNNTVITNAKDDRDYAPLCNYYRGIPLNNQDNRQSGDTYIYAVDNVTDVIDNSQATANDFKTWLASNDLEVYYVLEEPVVTEITSLYYETLYEQLQAIVDYETKLKIQEKIGG